MSMTLTNALTLVIADTREQNGEDLTTGEAVALARTLDMFDLDVVDDRDTHAAYVLVLSATDAELDAIVAALA